MDLNKKKLNKRKCNFCKEEFQKIYSIQPYCSLKCATKHKKEKDKLKGSKGKKKSIAPVSEKRLIQLAEYRVKREAFLSRPENHYCPVMKHFTAAHVRVTEIHHTNGREGDRLNDEEYWIAVSRPGHEWIHAHPKAARVLGWLV